MHRYSPLAGVGFDDAEGSDIEEDTGDHELDSDEDDAFKPDKEPVEDDEEEISDEEFGRFMERLDT